MSPAINITIPVFNEANVLERSIARLVAFSEKLSTPVEFVIANNGSTDETLQIAQALSRKFSNVAVLNCTGKGRGLALRSAWSRSKSKILTYMDCDLSTDLNCFPSLVAPVLKGEQDIVVGSRLLPTSRTIRGLKRTVISRGYNFLVHALFKTKLSDFQCGFKALRKEAFDRLEPLVKDNYWFFDTELLLRAEDLGYRIFDLPVTWMDDPDSKVAIVHSAFQHFRGLLRVRQEISRGRYPRSASGGTVAGDVNDSVSGYERPKFKAAGK